MGGRILRATILVMYEVYDVGYSYYLFTTLFGGQRGRCTTLCPVLQMAVVSHCSHKAVLGVQNLTENVGRLREQRWHSSKTNKTQKRDTI